MRKRLGRIGGRKNKKAEKAKEKEFDLNVFRAGYSMLSEEDQAYVSRMLDIGKQIPQLHNKIELTMSEHRRINESLSTELMIKFAADPEHYKFAGQEGKMVSLEENLTEIIEELETFKNLAQQLLTQLEELVAEGFVPRKHPKGDKLLKTAVLVNEKIKVNTVVHFRGILKNAIEGFDAILEGFKTKRAIYRVLAALPEEEKAKIRNAPASVTPTQ